MILVEEGCRSVSISPIDSTLRLDKGDVGHLVISAVLAITPWKGSSVKRWWYYIKRNSTFIINANLAELSGKGATTTFNRQIEGGLEWGLELNNHFALGLTVEGVFHRALRSHVLEIGRRDPPGQIVISGEAITELNPNNDQLFRDDNLQALSLKFILY